MCAAVVLVLIVLPVLGGVFGYAHWGAAGAWAGALGGLVLALGLGGGPFALLVNAERGKRKRDRAAWPELGDR